MDTRYCVTWKIDMYASSPREAAEQAWISMRADDSTANYFEVFDQDGLQFNVDLSLED